MPVCHVTRRMFYLDACRTWTFSLLTRASHLTHLVYVLFIVYRFFCKKTIRARQNRACSLCVGSARPHRSQRWTLLFLRSSINYFRKKANLHADSSSPIMRQKHQTIEKRKTLHCPFAFDLALPAFNQHWQWSWNWVELQRTKFWGLRSEIERAFRVSTIRLLLIFYSVLYEFHLLNGLNRRTMTIGYLMPLESDSAWRTSPDCQPSSRSPNAQRERISCLSWDPKEQTGIQ